MREPKEPYKLEPHRFKAKVCHWEYCIGCGLIALKGPLTAWAIKKGCNFNDHPDHMRKIKQFTGLYKT